MITIPLRMRVRADGTVTLTVPEEFREKEVEAVLVLHPLEPTPEPVGPEVLSPESRGWPPGFFEATAGSIADETFQRWPQGEYEARDEL